MQDLVVSANKIFYIIDVLLKMNLKLSCPEPSNILKTEKNLLPKGIYDKSFKAIIMPYFLTPAYI